MPLSRRLAALSFSSLAALAMASPALAGGFYLQEQSPRAIGRATAGSAAAADGADTVFFNPAGMTELDGTHVDLGGHLLDVESRQSDRGSERSVPGIPTPVATGGGNGGNPFANPVFVPSGYVTMHAGDTPIWLGLGVSAPFGLKVVYDDGWFGRYDSITSDAKTINVQPSIAVRLGEHFSVGGGLDIQTLDVTLSNALPNLSPLQPDGQLRVTGKDTAWSWNAGVLAKFGTVRVGAHYRARVVHNLDGRYAVSGLQGPLATGNGTLPARARITLPDIATGSVVLGAGTRARLLGSVSWYHWSLFDRIAIQPVGAPLAVSPQNYRDTWSGALGAEYDLTPRLTVRAGTMYDQTPTRDAFRTTRVPDGNRTWATAGMSWSLGWAALNLSYAHVFVKREPLDRTDAFYGGLVQTTVRSVNTGNADEVAASVSFRL